MNLILVTHITFAVLSVVFSTFLLFKPSKNKLNGVYILFGGALASGTYLVVMNSAHLIQTCITGIVYTAVVVGSIAVARRKIAKESA